VAVMSVSGDGVGDNVTDAVFRKISRRLMWFLFVLLVVSFMDRINIGFAALTMNKDLGLSAAAYGLSLTVFYAAYTLCEVPSNLILARVGARVWISRIMITWGLASAATMFAVDKWSLYGIRAAVGIAEAGFLPGILLYLTYWFPSSYRARTNALFIMGIPATIAIASSLSGLILQMEGFFGLAGWRWLFLLEGLPAVVLGLVCLFYLDDGPTSADWLSEEEKRQVAARLERDRISEQHAVSHPGVLTQLRSRNVVLLSIAYFGLLTSLNANATWGPQIVRMLVPSGTYVVTGLLTALPAVLALLAMPFWAASSDRKNERNWHVRIAMLAAGLGWLLVISSSDVSLRYAGLMIVSAGSFCGLLTFWTFPASSAILSAEARPAGIALINCIGIAGGSAIGPLVIGYLKDLSGSFTSGLIYVLVMLLVGVVCIAKVTGPIALNRAKSVLSP
jgi:ACS family 4-hydroxyphenylacetate permease-like MFS transporter